MSAFPRHEMGQGFTYLICDQPTSKVGSRVTATKATVTGYLPLTKVTSLAHALRVAVDRFPSGIDPALAEGKSNPYHATLDDQWPKYLTLWTMDAVAVAPVGDVGPFNRCGWTQIDVV